MASAYTVEKLLAFRPVKGLPDNLSPKVVSYLSLWRKYIRDLSSDPRRMAPDSTVVMRYQLGTPNKVFRRSWIHIHGTTAGLSDLPRYPIRVFSVRVKFLEEHIKRLNRLAVLLSKQYHSLRYQGLLGPQVKFGPPESVRSVPKPIRTVETVGTLVRRPAVKLAVRDAALQRQRLARKERLLMETVSSSLGTYSRPMGGIVRTDFSVPPPVDGRKWKKYWYFFRVRGVWHPSDHHPYGDEEPIITNWLNVE